MRARGGMSLTPINPVYPAGQAPQWYVKQDAGVATIIH